MAPAADRPGPPRQAVCDASLRPGSISIAAVRTSGTHPDEPVTASRIELSGLVDLPHEAETMAVCLAAMSCAAERGPLTVLSDSQAAVESVALLREGVFPEWIVRRESADGTAARIAVSAMTALALRPITVQLVPRAVVEPAHDDAIPRPRTDRPTMRPRLYAARQGLPLTWTDVDRGILTPTPFVRRTGPSTRRAANAPTARL